MNNSNNSWQNATESSKNSLIVYQEQIIKNYENRIHYLEEENKRLFDLLEFKEKREAVKDVSVLSSGDKHTFSFKKFFGFLNNNKN